MNKTNNLSYSIYNAAINEDFYRVDTLLSSSSISNKDRKVLKGWIKSIIRDKNRRMKEVIGYYIK